MIEPRIVNYLKISTIGSDSRIEKDFIMCHSDHGTMIIYIIRNGFTQVKIFRVGLTTFYETRERPQDWLRRTTAAQALDVIIERYPEEATWFLFHPE